MKRPRRNGYSHVSDAGEGKGNMMCLQVGCNFVGFTVDYNVVNIKILKWILFRSLFSLFRHKMRANDVIGLLGISI